MGIGTGTGTGMRTGQGAGWGRGWGQGAGWGWGQGAGMGRRVRPWGPPPTSAGWSPGTEPKGAAAAAAPVGAHRDAGAHPVGHDGGPRTGTGAERWGWGGRVGGFPTLGAALAPGNQSFPHVGGTWPRVPPPPPCATAPRLLGGGGTPVAPPVLRAAGGRWAARMGRGAQMGGGRPLPMQRGRHCCLLGGGTWGGSAGPCSAPRVCPQGTNWGEAAPALGDRTAHGP